MMRRQPICSLILGTIVTAFAVLTLSHSVKAQQGSCQRTNKADVVALDQAFYNNRLGAIQAGGMIFALRRDVVPNDGAMQKSCTEADCQPGKAMLRPDKRPRPIVLRVNVGDCLEVTFQNLLGAQPQVFNPNSTSAPVQQYPVQTGTTGYQANQNDRVKQSSLTNNKPFDPLASQSATRYAGVHVMGLNLVKAEVPDGAGGWTPEQSISADGSWVGANDVTATPPTTRLSGLVKPGDRIRYTWTATAQGAYLLYSTAANLGQIEGMGGQLAQGLFGSVTVQPQTAEWYRSQVTHDDLNAATYQSANLPPTMRLREGCQSYPNWWTLTITDGTARNVCVVVVDDNGNPVQPPNGYIKTPDGQPLINYDAVYPAGAKYPSGQPILPNTPVLKMFDASNTIVHTDLTAIITGPNHGAFGCNVCPNGECQNCTTGPDSTYPDRQQPFREFAIHYHDDFVSTQAFPPFRLVTNPPNENDPMSYTLQAGRDFFAINYGMAGIGAPIWANRLKLGPMHQCATCRFEEFFLSSWPDGDPAMVVDFPANSVDSQGKMVTGAKATKAFYPDDPSNVYHSYVSDHVRFQIVHAGTNIVHVHHTHAQQWLHTPLDSNSHYRDSQMISPGAAYSLDHVFGGSGNKNKTVGDSIFHCHFYPHFAQGMWGLWRVHDVFEEGTRLDASGRPRTGWNRALPDGEIATGTPTPALVPLPTLPMAPVPAKAQIVKVTAPDGTTVGYQIMTDPNDLAAGKSPGFPFFIPGVAGQRAPAPPLDFAPDPDDPTNPYLNGGLPRFIALKEVGELYEKHNKWDFTKFNDKLIAIQLDEKGTAVEQAAMKFNEIRFHKTFLPDGTPLLGPEEGFVLNGLPPVAGAPYADPGVTLDGQAVCPDNSPTCLKRYKAADIQLDLVLNKKGWHYPQSRITTLWGDVNDTLNNKRTPEPLFIRANSNQVIEYWLANLVPGYYDLDDFQVQTPTDVLGQHIHLVKFDVTSSDGAANGFNYEDGTLSPDEVRDLIKHINDVGGIYAGLKSDGTVQGPQEKLTAKPIPYFGNGPDNTWLGAQATIQRWYADPVFDNANFDLTLRTIFTHDHFGPSTHQQVGLYAGLLVEPTASTWQDPVTGAPLGSNLNRPLGANGKSIDDGGPTGWQANILTPDPKDSYREFALEFQDRQLAYQYASPAQKEPYQRYASPLAPWGWAISAQVPQPSTANPVNPPTNTQRFVTTARLPPFPHLITNSFGTGTYSLNYRNEPLAFRVMNSNPALPGPTADPATDLSSVFRSIKRQDPDLNRQPATGTRIDPKCDPSRSPCFTFPPPQVGAQPTDPYTPLLRAYEGDRVQVRMIVGGHMSPHYFTIHGLNWLFEPTTINATNNTSGYRGTQGMALSEHYEMLFNLPRTRAPSQADYLYAASSDATGLANGNWGILRAYSSWQTGPAPLIPLPNNTPPLHSTAVGPITAGCPAHAPKVPFDITVTTAKQALANGQLVYNSRGRAGMHGQQQIVDPHALMYVLTRDLDASGQLKSNVPREPLILRARAGDCITVTLRNKLKADLATKRAYQAESFGIEIKTSAVVGLHPQLVSQNVTQSNGVNVGLNPVITVNPEDKDNKGNNEDNPYTWYAGKIGPDGTPTPVEFGSIPLTPSDPLMQHPYGLIGALVIEPAGSKWKTDSNSRASAIVRRADGSKFREFVVVIQDGLPLPQKALPRDDLPGLQLTDTDPAQPAQTSGAINYRTEPIAYRYINTQDTLWGPRFLTNQDELAPTGIARTLSNTMVLSDPQTPVFAASATSPVIFRMVHPAGKDEQVFTLHGHLWQEEPYTNGSTRIGNNPLSQSQGSRDGFGPNVSFDAVISKAGGQAGVKGDYLYRTFIGRPDFMDGMWGVLRVGDPGKDIVTLTQFSQPTQTNSKILIAGTNTVTPDSGQMASQVKVEVTVAGRDLPPKTVPVDPMTGAWPATGGPIEVSCTAPCSKASVRASSVTGGGQAMLSSYIQVIGQNQPEKIMKIMKITPAAIPPLSLDEKSEVFRFKAPPLVSQPPPGSK